MSYWWAGSGGGSKGAPFHAGFLKARAEQGIEYDGAAGVSAGGLAALCIAMHPTLKEAAEYIERLALSVKTKDIHKRRFMGNLAGLWSPSLRDSAPFIDYMKMVTEGKQLHKPMRLGLTALTDPAGKMPDHEDEAAPGAVPYFVVDESFEPIWKAGYGTCAFPSVFEPMMVDGGDGERWCVDGGVQVVTPISSAIRAGATKIDVVIADTPWPSYRPTTKDPGNTLDVLLRCLELAVHRITWVDIRYTERINELVQIGAPNMGGKRYVEMNVIHPTSTLNEDSMVFDPREAAEIMLRGYRAGLESEPGLME